MAVQEVGSFSLSCSNIPFTASTDLAYDSCVLQIQRDTLSLSLFLSILSLSLTSYYHIVWETTILISEIYRKLVHNIRLPPTHTISHGGKCTLRISPSYSFSFFVL